MRKREEFSRTWILSEQFYLKNDEQSVLRTLSNERGELICQEDYRSLTKRGSLIDLVKSIKELEAPSPVSDCTQCRYKVGQYTGDPAYLLYVLFRFRLRLKLIKFKYRLVNLLKQVGFLKYKTSSS